MKLSPLVIAMSAIALPLSGCGGDSSNTSSDSSTYTIKAIDGYLRDAFVWLDINGNFKHDQGEPSAISLKNGVANLDVSSVADYLDHAVIVKAIPHVTIDEDTQSESNPNGVPIQYAFMMSAPAGEAMVTPLSTLVHLKLDAGNIEKDEAVQQVSNQLGIDPGDVLGDYKQENKEDILAKANAIVELELLPTTEDELATTSKDTSILDQGLTAHKDLIQNLTPDQRITKDESGDFVAIENVDKDGDGVIDGRDSFPDDGKEWLDYDQDGTGNNADLDDDDDGVEDSNDAFPFDKSESVDTDGDGIGNVADTDDDGDGYLDAQDGFPLDKTRAGDHDKDGYDSLNDAYPNDATKAGDHDEDGVDSIDDRFPNDKSESVDTDNDGYGDNLADKFPNNGDEWADADGDGYGDNKADLAPDDKDRAGDHDNDGIDTLIDNCPHTSNENQADSDKDGIGDACDTSGSMNAVWNTTNWNDSNWQ
ncbi:hypothetical protein [Vibrio cortegadensis]|uniref:hypothetical protein n=1 Tax=Vibrio cortegadensis TaxID=1328770 RepID=UPI00352E2A7D